MNAYLMDHPDWEVVLGTEHNGQYGSLTNTHTSKTTDRSVIVVQDVKSYNSKWRIIAAAAAAAACAYVVLKD